MNEKKKQRSARGFRIYHDHKSNEPCNRKLRVVQSSLVFSTDGDTTFDVYPVRIYGGIEDDGHVHLSLAQAIAVRDALNTYIAETTEHAGNEAR